MPVMEGKGYNGLASLLLSSADATRRAERLGWTEQNGRLSFLTLYFVGLSFVRLYFSFFGGRADSPFKLLAVLSLGTNFVHRQKQYVQAAAAAIQQ